MTSTEMIIESGILNLACHTCGGSGDGTKDPAEGTLPCPDCNGTGYRFWQFRRQCPANHWADNLPTDCHPLGYVLPPAAELAGLLVEMLGVDQSVHIWQLKGEWLANLAGAFPYYRGATLSEALAQALIASVKGV